MSTCHRRAGLCLAGGLLVPLSAAGCATQREHTVAQAATAKNERAPAAIPPELAVPDGQRLASELRAEGVQIYVCQQAAGTGMFGWVLRAPEAELFDRRGHAAGKHYAGPTWEALDGSTVVGARVAGFEAASGAIPWLLLRAARHAGAGLMSHVSYVQRLETAGGAAPEDGCDESQRGQEARVSYAAKYALYTPRLER